MDSTKDESVTCDSCGKKVASSVYLVNVEGLNLCDECEKDVKQEECSVKQNVSPESTLEPLEEKYSVLRMLNGLCKVLAVLVAIVAIFVAVVGRGMESFFAIVGGIVGVISLLAMAEMQKVFMDTEEGTREIVRQLKILNKK